MNILVIGSGGREHALAWKLAQSPQADTVYVAPGNAGTAMESNIKNIPLGPMDFAALADFAQQQQVGLTVVGPEQPLVAGIVDYFQSRGLSCFGPSKAASQLEGSKSYSKDFLQRHQIPTATYGSFTEVADACKYLSQCQLPIVIKADGLAAGKGVIIAETAEQAEETVRDMLSGNAFGEAGSRVVIEEFLQGEEASFIVMVDGDNVLPMATSQDHKRVGNADTGLNTGGMGAYSPAPVVTDQCHQRIMDEVILPTVAGMKEDGNPYSGFLYAGLMIDQSGNPKVIEFNCRFGDPETQPIMMRLESDFVALCLAAQSGRLHNTEVKWSQRSALGVVMAAGGYPLEYQKGYPINGLDQQLPNSKVFHAGSQLNANQPHQILTNGGRVLCVTALAADIKQAQKLAYQQLETIHWQDCFYRDDIGYRAIDRQ